MNKSQIQHLRSINCLYWIIQIIEFCFITQHVSGPQAVFCPDAVRRSKTVWALTVEKIAADVGYYSILLQIQYGPADTQQNQMLTGLKVPEMLVSCTYHSVHAGRKYRKMHFHRAELCRLFLTSQPFIILSCQQEPRERSSSPIYGKSRSQRRLNHNTINPAVNRRWKNWKKFQWKSTKKLLWDFSLVGDLVCEHFKDSGSSSGLHNPSQVRNRETENLWLLILIWECKLALASPLTLTPIFIPLHPTIPPFIHSIVVSFFQR